MRTPEIVGIEVLYSRGPYQRLRRYYRGQHPTLGVMHRGYSGWETIQEIDVIRVNKFNVQETPCASNCTIACEQPNQLKQRE